MAFPSNVWALILAGGDGSRLRPLTTRPGDTAVPKQFCSLAGGHTLVEDAIIRARGVIAAARICTVVAQHHREWWTDLLIDQPANNVIVQPRNRGADLGTPQRVAETLRRFPPDQPSHGVRTSHYVNLAAQQALFASKSTSASRERLRGRMRVNDPIYGHGGSRCAFSRDQAQAG